MRGVLHDVLQRLVMPSKAYVRQWVDKVGLPDGCRERATDLIAWSALIADRNPAEKPQMAFGPGSSTVYETLSQGHHGSPIGDVTGDSPGKSDAILRARRDIESIFFRSTRDFYSLSIVNNLLQM